MTKVDYYYDFVSPFSYLLHEQLNRLPNQVELNYVPVLFAGLLKFWGNLGPVEIERKKLFTYRHTTWLANKLDLPFRTPDTHPFNPLPYLRLSIAKENDPALVTAIFRAIWTTENDPATDAGRANIWKTVNIPDADQLIADTNVKNTLISNTQMAAEKGVFGVPTFTVNGELFWGLDSLEFLLEYLADSNLFESDSMARLDHIE